MDPGYRFLEDGSFRYTKAGKERYRQRFAEHSIDVNNIHSFSEHLEAIDYCASEAIAALKEDTQISSLDRDILLAAMEAPDNEQAKALIREKEVLQKRSQIRLVQKTLVATAKGTSNDLIWCGH